MTGTFSFSLSEKASNDLKFNVISNFNLKVNDFKKSMKNNTYTQCKFLFERAFGIQKGQKLYDTFFKQNDSIKFISKLNQDELISFLNFNW